MELGRRVKVKGYFYSPCKMVGQQQQGEEELPEAAVSKMPGWVSLQNLNSNLNTPSSKLTFLDMHNSKVFCLPCISCSQLPKPKQRAFIIICNNPYLHQEIVRLDRMRVPEPARSSVGSQTLLHREEKSLEVNSPDQKSSTKERDVIKKEADVDKTGHSQTANVTLAAERYKRKQLSVRKFKRTDKSIGLEDLQLHFGKRRKEAAKSLNVSISTLKRIARQHRIPSWPYSKINKSKGAEGAISQTSLSTERPFRKIPTELPTCETHPKELAVKTTDVQTPRPEMTAMKDLTTKAVKVKFGNDIVRFEISASSKLVDLEEKVAKRLKLETGSFNISYFDEDRDLVLIACDADWWYCMRLLGTTTIRMVVIPIVN